MKNLTDDEKLELNNNLKAFKFLMSGYVNDTSLNVENAPMNISTLRLGAVKARYATDNRNILLHNLQGKIDSLEGENASKKLTSLLTSIEDTNKRRYVLSSNLDLDQNKALHYATNKGDLKLVSSLLNFGANPNQPNLEGDTPLHLEVKRAIGAKTKDLTMLKKLLANGASPAIANAKGLTAFDLASKETSDATTEQAKEVTSLLKLFIPLAISKIRQLGFSARKGIIAGIIIFSTFLLAALWTVYFVVPGVSDVGQFFLIAASSSVASIFATLISGITKDLNDDIEKKKIVQQYKQATTPIQNKIDIQIDKLKGDINQLNNDLTILENLNNANKTQAHKVVNSHSPQAITPSKMERGERRSPYITQEPIYTSPSSSPEEETATKETGKERIDGGPFKTSSDYKEDTPPSSRSFSSSSTSSHSERVKRSQEQAQHTAKK